MSIMYNAANISADPPLTELLVTRFAEKSLDHPDTKRVAGLIGQKAHLGHLAKIWAEIDGISRGAELNGQRQTRERIRVFGDEPYDLRKLKGPSAVVEDEFGNLVRVKQRLWVMSLEGEGKMQATRDRDVGMIVVHSAYPSGLRASEGLTKLPINVAAIKLESKASDPLFLRSVKDPEEGLVRFEDMDSKSINPARADLIASITHVATSQS